VEASVLDYIVRLTSHVRHDPRLRLGTSPRGSLDLCRGSQTRAFLAGRDHVRPDDVQALAAAVLAHRVALDVKALHGGVSGATIVDDALESVKVPG
jgi:MoxR-like ATPase